MDTLIGLIGGVALTIMLELLALDAFLTPIRELFAGLFGVST